MTTKQLGTRLGVSQPTALGFEKSEVAGSITLDSLTRVANALDCRLVYVVVPRKRLEALVEERARELARRRLPSVSHSMALEDQRVEVVDEEDQLEGAVRRLLDQPGSALWEAE